MRTRQSNHPTVKQFLFSLLFAVCAATAAEATWVYENNTLSNDDWSFAGVKVATVNGVSGLSITGTPTQKGSVTVIDFTQVETDTGYKVVSHTGDGNLRMCTEYIGPDVTVLGNMFYGAGDGSKKEYPPNLTLTSVTVSPDITSIGTFKYCPSLTIVKTTATMGDVVVFPKLTSIAKELFRQDSALAGSYEFTVLKNLQGKMMMGTAVRELRFPSLTYFDASYDYMFSGCSKLETCYMPKVTIIGKAVYTWNGCSSLTTLTLPDNVDFPDGIGDCTFNNCSKLTSFPNLTFPTATTVAGNAFCGCGITGKLSVPQATSIGDNAFNSCKLSEIYAPKAVTIGSASGNTFRNCTNLEKLTLGSVCSTDGKTPKKGIMTLKSTGSDIYLTGNAVPTAFNDGYWMQPSTTVLATLNARVWMKTGTDSTWEAWKAQFSGTSGFVEKKDFTTDYTSSPTYPGDDVTIGCFNNLGGGYAWICEWGTYDAVVKCPVGVQVKAFRADGEKVTPASDGTYKILKSSTVEIDYQTVGDYLFADGTSTANATGLAAAASYAASVCPKEVVACEAKIGDTLYRTLQEAFTAGGSVTQLKNVAPAAALTVAADKTVVLALGGFTNTIDGTVFDVAGSLTVNGEGVVHGTAFAGKGSIKLTGGTYDFDVNAYCVPGFLAEEQGTTPETWKVVQNTDVAYLNVAQTDLAAANVGAVGLDFAGVYTCVTNEGTISFQLPKNAPFSVVFTAASGYRFEGAAKTRTKTYEDGIEETTMLTALDIPVAESCPVWTFDTTTSASQAYLLCGDVKLKVTMTQDSKTKAYSYLVTRTSEAGDSYTGLEISGVDALGDATEVDFTAVADAAGYDVISIASSVFSGKAVTKVKAPHVVYLAYGVFNGNATIQSVEVSPNLYFIGGRCFMQTPALTNFEPHVLAKIESFGADYYNFKLTAIRGDYVFGKMKSVPFHSFESAANITALSFPEAEIAGNSAVCSCSSLTNFYGPKLIDIQPYAFQTDSKLETIVFSTAITNLSGAFYQDGKITSMPEANWTNLLYIGGSNFESSKYALGDVNVPLLTKTVGRDFYGAQMTSCYAPLLETVGQYSFAACPLTNVTIKGSANCFSADYAFMNVKTLKDINWLGDEAPTKLYKHSLLGGTSQKPVVVRVKSGKDIAGWEKICTKTRKAMEGDANVDVYKRLAEQCGLKWSRVVGFIGTVSSSKGIAYGSAVGDNCCWIYNDGILGVSFIIK